MTFGTLPLPLTLPFPFSDYLLLVPLSGQFFYCCHLNLPGVGERRHWFPVMLGLGSFSRLAWPLSLVTFPIFISFPPNRPRDPGRVMQRKKARAVGSGRVRDHYCQELVLELAFCFQFWRISNLRFLCWCSINLSLELLLTNFLSVKMLFLWARRALSLRLTCKVCIFLGGPSRIPALFSSKTASSPLTGLAKGINLDLLFVTMES